MKNLPQLKIIPLDEVLLHEEFSPGRVQKLAEIIVKDSSLRNPIVVANIKSIGKYMVLDGATRTTALASLKFRDILCQVVNYEDHSVTLETWCHVMSAHNYKHFFEKVKQNIDLTLEYSSAHTAQTSLHKREILSYFMFFDNTCLLIKENSGKISEQMEKLRHLVLLCEEQGNITRVNFSDIGGNLKRNSEINMVHVFPSYKKQDLIRLAQSGLKMPAGITRHVIPGRVLGFQINASLLKTSQISLNKKNEILREILDYKLSNDKIRFYPEGIYLFNEY